MNISNTLILFSVLDNIFSAFLSYGRKKRSQRKAAKGKEPCGGSLPLDTHSPLYALRSNAVANSGRFILSKIRSGIMSGFLTMGLT